MASVQATAGARNPKQGGGGNPQPSVEGCDHGPGIEARGPFGSRRPLSIAGLDAALSETRGQPCRADRLARDDRVYRALVRRSYAVGSPVWRTTYAEIARAAGYDVPRLDSRANRLEARQRRVSTVYRALQSLQAAGLLRFGGFKRPNGQWRCLFVRLLPAAFDPAPRHGRSQRAPNRCPGGRVRFLRRSGTSPAVGESKQRSEQRRRTRAREEEVPEVAVKEAGPLAKAMIRYLTTLRERGPTPWPLERWEVRLPEVVALVELFEDFHDDGAAFSFRHHAEDLVRILERLDRYAWAAPYSVVSRREQGRGGCGYHHAWRLITSWGRRYRAGNRAARRVRSLAYFLPRLDQESKQWRRQARRTEEREGLR